MRPAGPAPPPPPRHAGDAGPDSDSDDGTGGACAGSAGPGASGGTAPAMRPGRGRPGHRPGVGGPRAGDHRQGRGPALRAGRAGELPAAPAARRPARRAEPAAGHRVLPVGPGRDPQRRHPARPALPLGRRLQPARQRLRSPPRQAQEERRQDQHQGLRPAVLLPPPDRHPQMGLDPGPEPRRDHHGLEPGQNQDPPQPRPTRPARGNTPGVRGRPGIHPSRISGASGCRC